MTDVVTTEVGLKIERLEAVAAILRSHQDFLERHSYDGEQDAAREASEHGTVDYEKLTYVSIYYGGYRLELDVQGPDSLQLGTLLRREIGGMWEKRVNDYNYMLERDIDGARVLISTPRDVVCTKRVVGQEPVTIPAVEAKPERTEMRDVVEWDCNMLSDDPPASAA